MTEPILKNVDGVKQKVRIFRPSEVKLLLDEGIPKFENQIQFKSLLYSGTRYVELQRLHDNPQWFDKQFIHLPSGKKLARQKDRWVHLNPQGREVIGMFLQSKQNLPATNVWTENLMRWCQRCGLSTEGLSPKTTRKTWESWLVWYYPEKQTLILTSQGHTDLVSFNYYLNMPFNETEKVIMKGFVEGWI